MTMLLKVIFVCTGPCYRPPLLLIESYTIGRDFAVDAYMVVLACTFSFHDYIKIFFQVPSFFHPPW
jgi:hypothetical protein